MAASLERDRRPDERPDVDKTQGRKMRSLATLTVVVLTAVAVALGSPSAIASTPPVTLLYQNNLDWQDDVNHDSFLLVNSALSHKDASDACARLGEKLVAASSARSQERDLVPLLQYAILRGDIAAGQSVWLADASAKISATRLDLSYDLNGASRPALCTQSARGTTQATSLASGTNRVNTTSSATGNLFSGFRDLKSFRFLGIPYANAPARFTYSKVASSRNTHLDASQFGATCYQGGSGPYSEDCLFLNIFSPYLPGSSKDKSKLRPVVVWIHGGEKFAALLVSCAELTLI
jgi:hypothetical protein